MTDEEREAKKATALKAYYSEEDGRLIVDPWKITLEDFRRHFRRPMPKAPPSSRVKTSLHESK